MYLSETDILVIHAKILDKTGGLHGVRDIGLLSSVIARPQTCLGGQEMFPSVYQKAAAYLESIAKMHVFLDGNKRTAIASSARFLFLNGYDLVASNDEVEMFVVEVVVKKLEIMAIAAWFELKSKKIAQD